MFVFKMTYKTDVEAMAFYKGMCEMQSQQLIGKDGMVYSLIQMLK